MQSSGLDFLLLLLLIRARGEREALQLNTHSVTQEDGERKPNTVDAGAWETGFPGFPTHKLTNTHTGSDIHTCTSVPSGSGANSQIHRVILDLHGDSD